MLLPLSLFGFFVWYPMVHNVILAFSTVDGTFTITGFAGFDNFIHVFNDDVFMTALGNTFMYAFYSLLIGFFVPILVALLLSEIVHLKGFFRVMFYVPAIISGITVAILWRELFSPDAHLGFLNVVITSLGLPASQWLLDSASTIPLIIVTMTWRGFGATVLIYLATLQTVDNQQYEAARIDGAGPVRRIWNVTVPHVIPLIRILFVLQLISVFQVFVEPLVMTDGGPNNASISLLMLAHEYAFRGMISRPGSAAALSVLTAAMIMAFTVIYLRVTRSDDAKNKSKAKKAVRLEKRQKALRGY